MDLKEKMILVNKTSDEIKSMINEFVSNKFKYKKINKIDKQNVLLNNEIKCENFNLKKENYLKEQEILRLKLKIESLENENNIFKNSTLQNQTIIENFNNKIKFNNDLYNKNYNSIKQISLSENINLNNYFEGDNLNNEILIDKIEILIKEINNKNKIIDDLKNNNLLNPINYNIISKEEDLLTPILLNKRNN